MSVVYGNSTQVIRQEIEKLINLPLKISGEYIDTYDLYGSDNKLLLSLEKHKKDSAEATFNVRVSNIGFNEQIELEPNWHIENLYFRVKPFFDIKYSTKKLVDFNYTTQDAAEYYSQSKDSKDYNQNRFIMDLIYNLYKARCPVDRIQKIIYYLDKKDSKHEFPAGFEILNHNNKLGRYETPRKNSWFFSGEKYSRSFAPMDAEAQEIFDMVKNALEKQKHNIK